VRTDIAHHGVRRPDLARPRHPDLQQSDEKLGRGDLVTRCDGGAVDTLKMGSGDVIVGGKSKRRRRGPGVIDAAAKRSGDRRHPDRAGTTEDIFNNSVGGVAGGE